MLVLQNLFAFVIPRIFQKLLKKIKSVNLKTTIVKIIQETNKLLN